jgi:hypothetical protein
MYTEYPINNNNTQNKKMLLVERDSGYISIDDDRNKKSINEITKLNNDIDIKENQPLIVYVVLQKWGVKNKNGRIYPKHILERENDRYQELIRERRAIGECVPAGTEIFTKNGWRLNAGVGYEYARYFNSTFNNVTIQGQPFIIDYESNLYMSKFAGFGQLSRALLDDRLNLSFGLRTDFSNYSKSLSNPLEQLSPSFSASFKLSEKWALNGNIARYHQLPAYTILGYINNSGELANKLNNIKYIRADHFVLGTEYLTKINSRFTVEGFYKNYSRYPFSIKDSLCLANVGSDFGVVGNEEVKSISSGRSYGFEFLYQQKLYKGFYAVLAYTYVRSEFKDKNGLFVPTSWDSRNIISLTGGKRFNKGWEVGFRWLFSGGSPYTPVDVENSSLIQNWNINGFAFPDYTKLNTQRDRKSVV